MKPLTIIILICIFLVIIVLSSAAYVVAEWEQVEADTADTRTE